MEEMKIDKEKIAALCALPDAALWGEIVRIGKEYGFTLPTTPPDHEAMEKIRSAANGGSKIDLTTALKLINAYRRSAK